MWRQAELKRRSVTRDAPHYDFDRFFEATNLSIKHYSDIEAELHAT